MKNRNPIRLVSSEFDVFCRERQKRYKTKYVDETKNVVDFLNFFGSQLGFDPMNVPMKKQPDIKLNKKVLIFK